MEYLETNIEQIRLWVKENYTHCMISDMLKQSFPEVTRGFSERNIRLFCSKHEIHKKSDLEVDSIVEDSLREVCIRMHTHNLYRKVAGHKLHCDQNEKLSRYDCTLFAFNDGCSSKIVQMFCMPKKNATIVYSQFRFI